MARLTRDFSGKAAAQVRRGRAPAWAVQVMERRAAGERVGLLLVSVDCWDGGEYFKGRPAVERVCALEDFDIAAGDWSVVAGLDVLVCGVAGLERFNLAALACLSAGAASVWGEYEDGIARLEYWPLAPFVVAPERSVPVDGFGAALARFREVSMLLGDGFYGAAAFTSVRAGLLDRLGVAR